MKLPKEALLPLLVLREQTVGDWQRCEGESWSSPLARDAGVPQQRSFFLEDPILVSAE